MSPTHAEPAITHFAILVPGTAKRFREMLQNTCRREFGDSGACVDMAAIDYHADMHALGTTNE
ncbi:hypothetical protein GGH94_005705 [Coemansia aciculifera]|uniref:Uncharacterized protein n=1 Tax=Coemansia aciculifera TaxID=417176 RepID=A0A9W8IHZ2_9FUNG|nr:hypothetical protein GGH94_005705 [Coemansia aciculifera]